MSHISDEIHGKVFYVDGSLRDVYVKGPITLDDWTKTWQFLRSLDNISLNVDGEADSHLPKKVTDIFQARQEKSIFLKIEYKQVTFHCHFFSEDEIELDVNPATIKVISGAKSVIDFMMTLSKVTNKDVSISIENDKQSPLITVKATGEFETYY
jgi:hypothetical protein